MKTTRHCSLMLLMMLIAVLTMVPMAITGSTAAADARDEAAGPTVTLIEAGAEPRRALRLTARPGDTERVIFSQHMQMEQAMNGMDMPSMPMPVTEFQFTAEIDQVDEDGTIHYTGTYEKVSVKDDPGVEPGMRRSMEQMMQSMVGVEVKVATTERGFIRSFELKADEVRNPMLQQILQGLRGAFEQNSMPLPEEPVGVGAKWKSESSMKFQGMKMDMVLNVTLTDLTETSFQLSSELTMHAEEQSLDDPNLPRGMEMTLKSMGGSGEGQFTFRDARLMPLGTMNSSTEMEFEVKIPQADQPQRMVQKMQVEQEIREAGADDEPQEAEADE